jgi:hypothetical protein
VADSGSVSGEEDVGRSPPPLPNRRATYAVDLTRKSCEVICWTTAYEQNGVANFIPYLSEGLIRPSLKFEKSDEGVPSVSYSLNYEGVLMTCGQQFR